MPIVDDDLPPPESEPEPDAPQVIPEPEPDRPGFDDPGLQPQPEPPTFIPEPEPEPEPEPDTGTDWPDDVWLPVTPGEDTGDVDAVRGDPDLLLVQGTDFSDLVCFSGDDFNNWQFVYDHTTIDWFQSGWKVNEPLGVSYPVPFTNGSFISALGTSLQVPDSDQITLTTDGLPNSTWQQVKLVMAPDCHMKMGVRIVGTGNPSLGDYEESFSAILEGGDNIEVSVSKQEGSGVISQFHLVKNQLDYMDPNALSDISATYDNISIQLTVENLTVCRVATEELDPDLPQWDDDDADDDEGGNGTDDDFVWTRDDAWVLLGVLVAILLVSFVRNNAAFGRGKELASCD